jgi:hypothetical protein
MYPGSHHYPPFRGVIFLKSFHNCGNPDVIIFFLCILMVQMATFADLNNLNILIFK